MCRGVFPGCFKLGLCWRPALQTASPPPAGKTAEFIACCGKGGRSPLPQILSGVLNVEGKSGIYRELEVWFND